MDRQEEQAKREEFKSLLNDLALDPYREKTATPEKRLKYQRRFETLYQHEEKEKGFRHLYSDIFRILAALQEDPEKGNGDVLAENIQILLEEYKPEKGHFDARDNLRKLYDHISLDLARMNYTQTVVHSFADQASDQAINRSELEGIRESIQHENKSLREMASIVVVQTKNAVERLKEAVERLKEAEKETDLSRRELEDAKRNLQTTDTDLQKSKQQLTEAKKSLDEATKKIDNSQKEYIAILGIFSAVVLTFIGGMAFSTSVLENIHKSSAYRLTFTVALIGLVLYNVFYLLFFCIQNLLERKVEEHQTNMLRNGNILFVMILLITVLFWWFGAVENRDVQFSERVSPIPTEAVTTVTSQKTS